MKLRPPLSPLAGTMTYDLESTLPMITVHPHWDAPAYFEAEEVPFERKHDAAVMFTSNCKNAGAQKRLAYYEELMSHMDVHSYGKCLHNKDEPPKAKGVSPNESKRRILASYKFYLAFENDVVKDYVSEKVYDGLLAGTLSVYRGAATVDALLPGARSVVKVEQFPSPAQLAGHLRHLAANKTAYEEYFAWKRRPRADDAARFQRVLDMTAYKYTALCRVCHHLAESQGLFSAR